jgi:hypothetical protein
MNTVLRIAASPAVRRLGGLFTPSADAIELPAYPTPAAA